MKMQIVRFGDLYAIPSGNGLSRPTAVRGEGYRMIGMGELFANDIINDIEMDRVQMSDREKQSFFVEPDDLLFARQSLVAAGAGKCSIVKELEEPTTYESHLIRVRLDKNKCNPWYYYYLFKLPDNPIKTIVNQCAQAGIRGNELVKIKVPLPQRPCQDRIVSVLSSYDKLIEANNKRIKVLEQMAENLYKEWFVRFRFPDYETIEFENGVPKGWEYSTLGRFALIEMGQSPESKYYNYDSIGLPFHQGVGSYGDYYLIDDMYSSQGNRIGEPNSIIFSVRAPVGRINMTLKKIILGRGVAAINSREGYNWFLLYMLKNRFKLDDMIGNGSIFSAVKKEELQNQKFLIPPTSLVKKYDYIAKQIERQMRLLYLSSANLIQQRDLLLPRLMSGKLEV